MKMLNTYKNFKKIVDIRKDTISKNKYIKDLFSDGEAYDAEKNTVYQSPNSTKK